MVYKPAEEKPEGPDPAEVRQETIQRTRTAAQQRKVKRLAVIGNTQNASSNRTVRRNLPNASSESIRKCRELSSAAACQFIADQNYEKGAEAWRQQMNAYTQITFSKNIFTKNIFFIFFSKK